MHDGQPRVLESSAQIQDLRLAAAASIARSRTSIASGVFGLKRTVNGVRGARLRHESRRRTFLRATSRDRRCRCFLKPEQVWPVVNAVSTIYRDHGYRHQPQPRAVQVSRRRIGAHERLARGDRGAARIPNSSLRTNSGYRGSGDGPPRHPQAKAGRSLLGRRVFPRRAHPQWHAREKSAALAARHCAPGQDAIRLTNKQNLLILNVPEKNLAALNSDLDGFGLDYQPTQLPQRLRELHGHRILQSRRRRDKEPHARDWSISSRPPAVGIRTRSASTSADARVPAASIRSPTSVSVAQRPK